MAPLIPGMMEIDVRQLLSTLKEAGVGSVSAGALRFQGYAKSKEMFEEAVGTPAYEMMVGADAMMEKVRSLTEEFGFEARERFFDWKPAGGMEEFLPTAPIPIS